MLERPVGAADLPDVEKVEILQDLPIVLLIEADTEVDGNEAGLPRLSDTASNHDSVGLQP